MSPPPASTLHGRWALPDIFAQATRREHTAVVMVTHDERLLTECDRVLTIQDGKLQESTPEQASQQV
ncbi:MAG: hypothetical protein LKI23_03100 [Bifidobacterium crudilactis]|nr:hypothetical protein [Bifidobacterium crudilactis]